MLKGKCTDCGAQFFGWSLRKTEERRCPNCNAELAIMEDGYGVFVNGNVTPSDDEEMIDGANSK